MTPTPSRRRQSPARIQRVSAPLRQELLELVRTAISSGDYLPGERLVELDLCEIYGVSRTVVREVVRHLEAEGLVTIAPNRGPVVTEFSRKDATDLFEVRAVLESLAAAQFAESATTEERQRLEKRCDQVAEAYKDGDIELWLSAKDAYYEVLLAGTHNELIRSTVLSIHTRVQLLRTLSLQNTGRLPQSLDEIRKITSLAVGGATTDAAEAARLHVERAAIAAFDQIEEVSDRGHGEEITSVLPR